MMGGRRCSLAFLLSDVTSSANGMLSSSVVRSFDCVTETGYNQIEGKDGMEGGREGR